MDPVNNLSFEYGTDRAEAGWYQQFSDCPLVKNPKQTVDERVYERLPRRCSFECFHRITQGQILE